jgi:PAP2 superfamily
LRQLLVVLLAWIVQGVMIQFLVAPMVQRLRPFGVQFRTDWTAWALPSEQMAALVVVLVGILYGLVPEGRWRQIGKWVATGLVVLIALARMYLGVEAPTDILVGVAIGVAIPLLCFRLLAPSQVFPISYRRGRAAHLDVGGARGQAIRRALQDQLGLVVEEVEPFGAGRLGRLHPAAGHGHRRPADRAVRQAVCPHPPALGSLVQAGPGAAVRAAGG